MNYSSLIIFFVLSFTALTIYLTAYLLSVATDVHAKRDVYDFQIKSAIGACVLYLALDNTTSFTNNLVTKAVFACTVTSIFVMLNLVIGQRLSKAMTEWRALQASS